MGLAWVPRSLWTPFRKQARHHCLHRLHAHVVGDAYMRGCMCRYLVLCKNFRTWMKSGAIPVATSKSNPLFFSLSHGLCISTNPEHPRGQWGGIIRPYISSHKEEGSRLKTLVATSPASVMYHRKVNVTFSDNIPFVCRAESLWRQWAPSQWEFTLQGPLTRHKVGPHKSPAPDSWKLLWLSSGLWKWNEARHPSRAHMVRKWKYAMWQAHRSQGSWISTRLAAQEAGLPCK